VQAAAPDTSVFDLDSMGRYNDPPISDYQAQFSAKMHVFWKFHNDARIVFVGSSQMQNGVDCGQIKSGKAVNLGYAAGGLLGMEILINDYVLPHCPNLTVVGIGTTPYWLYEKDGDESWQNQMSLSKGYQYDRSHNFWRSSPLAGFDQVLADASYRYFCGFDTINSSYPQPCNGWGANPPALGGRIDWDTSDTNYKINFDRYRALALYLAALNIHVIFVNFTESPGFQGTDHYAVDGPSWPTGRAIMAGFKSLEAESPFIHFYDAYQDGRHDYTDADAQNSNHLCAAGAIKLSTRLDSLIAKVLAAP
jgi:hypothetical protein